MNIINLDVRCAGAAANSQQAFPSPLDPPAMTESESGLASRLSVVRATPVGAALAAGGTIVFETPTTFPAVIYAPQPTAAPDPSVVRPMPRYGTPMPSSRILAPKPQRDLPHSCEESAFRCSFPKEPSRLNLAVRDAWPARGWPTADASVVPTAQPPYNSVSFQPITPAPSTSVAAFHSPSFQVVPPGLGGVSRDHTSHHRWFSHSSSSHSFNMADVRPCAASTSSRSSYDNFVSCATDPLRDTTFQHWKRSEPSSNLWNIRPSVYVTSPDSGCCSGSGCPTNSTSPHRGEPSATENQSASTFSREIRPPSGATTWHTRLDQPCIPSQLTAPVNSFEKEKEATPFQSDHFEAPQQVSRCPATTFPNTKVDPLQDECWYGTEFATFSNTKVDPLQDESWYGTEFATFPNTKVDPLQDECWHGNEFATFPNTKVNPLQDDCWHGAEFARPLSRTLGSSVDPCIYAPATNIWGICTDNSAAPKHDLTADRTKVSYNAVWPEMDTTPRNESPPSASFGPERFHSARNVRSRLGRSRSLLGMSEAYSEGVAASSEHPEAAREVSNPARNVWNIHLSLYVTSPPEEGIARATTTTPPSEDRYPVNDSVPTVPLFQGVERGLRASTLNESYMETNDAPGCRVTTSPASAYGTSMFPWQPPCDSIDISFPVATSPSSNWDSSLPLYFTPTRDGGASDALSHFGVTSLLDNDTNMTSSEVTTGIMGAESVQPSDYEPVWAPRCGGSGSLESDSSLSSIFYIRPSPYVTSPNPDSGIDRFPPRDAAAQENGRGLGPPAQGETNDTDADEIIANRFGCGECSIAESRVTAEETLRADVDGRLDCALSCSGCEVPASSPRDESELSLSTIESAQVAASDDTADCCQTFPLEVRSNMWPSQDDTTNPHHENTPGHSMRTNGTGTGMAVNEERHTRLADSETEDTNDGLVEYGGAASCSVGLPAQSAPAWGVYGCIPVPFILNFAPFPGGWPPPTEVGTPLTPNVPRALPSASTRNLPRLMPRFPTCNLGNVSKRNPLNLQKKKRRRRGARVAKPDANVMGVRREIKSVAHNRGKSGKPRSTATQPSADKDIRESTYV